MTIDELAGIIKNEFDNTYNRFDNIDSDIKKLKEDHERLDLRMSNFAYRFEVDDLKNQLVSLNQRVNNLENK